jgi:hypothetical protein
MAEPIKRRRWFRFSLRMLLLVVTVLCVWLGFKVNAARRQKEAVEAILRAGGNVDYDFQALPDLPSGAIAFHQGGEPWEPQWLLALLGPDFFHNVISVSLEGSVISRDELTQLSSLSKLRLLNLGAVKVRDSDSDPLRPIMDGDLLTLRSFPMLVVLALDRAQITNAGMHDIEPLVKLNCLGPEHTLIDDVGVAYLCQLHHLARLFLDGTKVTDAGLKHLHGLKYLNDIHLPGTQVTSDGICELQKALPNTKIYGP